jgi:thioredoxin-related protein
MKLFNILFFTIALVAVSCNSQSATEVNQTPEKAQQAKQVESVPVKPTQTQKPQTVANTSEMKWYTLEEAVEMNKKSPRPMLIDVYTDWCGWCKVMDRQTFADPTVQAYISENFYPVKFNAEQKDIIEFNGKSYKFVAGGRRGHNELAAHLLNNRLGYPSFAFLDSDYNHLHITVGFKKPDQFMSEMKNAMAKNNG